ncbi:MAG: hypothetical protein JJ974_10055 [Phycisphaerales bacterium]|nr:hypothetical protein [Phycisphaerales bacterium]
MKAERMSITQAISVSVVILCMLPACGEQSSLQELKSESSDSIGQPIEQITEQEVEQVEAQSDEAEEETSVSTTVDPEPEGVEAAINADDGYPTGQSTPEGAACDLARSFIQPDGALFQSVCLSWPHGQSGEAYTEFINNMGTKMDSMQGKNIADFGGPKQITAVYKARYLSRSGPGSFGFAVMDLHDVMFVDVVAETWEDSTFLSRTLVVQKSNKKWYAMPRPDLFPLLSAGLNEESDSTTLWNEESP